MTERQFKLGIIINPYAGIGGATALKGSDGKLTRELALAQGAEKLANQKMQRALAEIRQHIDRVTIFTVAGEMGEQTARQLGFKVILVHTPTVHQTESEDSVLAAKNLVESGVDIIAFAGGDGTATDIFQAIGDVVPVLGIPAGCKIHSGVYAVSPSTAGKVLNMLISGEIVSLKEAEVRDIDESAFRSGKVISRQVGEMRVPEELRYIQAVKMGGKEVDELVISDMADYLREIMEEHPDSYFVMGSGSTVDGIMQVLGLPNTLLGVDVVKANEVITSDVSARQLETLITNKSVKIVLTLIGGQGHIFGRGNQQLSPTVIKQTGRDNLIIVATKAKLKSLDSRPIVVDTGDKELDSALSGPINVVTGYRDHVLYPITDYN
jgi:predicted polyphosphate/ATP-dependent NAD kinase